MQNFLGGLQGKDQRWKNEGSRDIREEQVWENRA